MVTPRHHVPCGLHRAGTADRHASHRPRVGRIPVVEDRGQCGGGGGEEEAEGVVWGFVRRAWRVKRGEWSVRPPFDYRLAVSFSGI